ncbi:unnamed protein product [Echinostoma caproni]|uniref:Uncharacterized protein n=1 Tax=Echinostoma caproni TaxID=27848 RepID=A0A183B3P9_9TREM|nr:unnamed protein product [Echinostoma caproni]
MVEITDLTYAMVHRRDIDQIHCNETSISEEAPSKTFMKIRLVRRRPHLLKAKATAPIPGMSTDEHTALALQRPIRRASQFAEPLLGEKSCGDPGLRDDAYPGVRWAEEAVIIGRLGRESNFTELTEFIRNRAKVASSRSGLASMSRQEEKHHVKERIYEILRSSRSANNYAAVGERGTPSCSMYRLNHELSACEKFVQLEVPDRW